MPNLTDIDRIIYPPSVAQPARLPASPKGLVSRIAEGLLKLSPGARAASKEAGEAINALADSLSRLPRTLLDDHPKTSAVVASNGDYIQLPMHARQFRLVYLEGIAPEESLKKVLEDAGLSPDLLWTPDLDAGSPFLPLLGNVAFYGIEFQDGDLGPYKEFFLLIKLKTHTGTSTLRDMFVWRLCVDSKKAQAWGSPWAYPKKYYEPIGILFDGNELATEFSLPSGTADDGTYFPTVSFKRKGAPITPLTRWSHEAQGGGFSFLNPTTQDYPRGYLAPIENQGEVWIEPYSKAVHDVSITGANEFTALAGVDWRMVFSGRQFQALAKPGSPA